MMLEPSMFQARCARCGFNTPEFNECHSGKLGDPFRFVTTYSVICTACGTLHKRQTASIDYPGCLHRFLIIGGVCALPVVIVVAVSKDVLTRVVAGLLACAIAAISIRICESAISKHLRTRWADWIEEVDSGSCPSCGCEDAVGPSRAPQLHPCPRCGENSLSILCTYKGQPRPPRRPWRSRRIKPRC